ncbi:MAG TPA: phosphate ABC transporter permease subunit PstC [Acidimicrobiia bacterium]|nr:phosphate ABC transporter permease subunit PstC [Acidimicrobiia bacterium]
MTTPTTRDSGAVATGQRSLEAASPRYGEKLIKAFLAVCGILSVAVTTSIVVSLVLPTIEFFQEVSIFEFFTGTLWAPLFANASFGVWPIVVGSLMVMVISLAVAVPVGLLSAIYLSEYARPRVRRIVKPVLEVLAGIPTVAIGLFAFWFIRPLAETLLPFLPWQGPFSVGVAALGVGLLIVPVITSIADDSMRAVPASLRQGGYALGATKFEVATKIVFPAAISGIVAAIVLGGSRAIGETMVVFIAAGAGNPFLSFDPTKGVQTMTAFIAGAATGDIPTGTSKYYTIFAVGSLLFLFTLSLNALSMRFVRRFREEYE